MQRAVWMHCWKNTVARPWNAAGCDNARSGITSGRAAVRQTGALHPQLGIDIVTDDVSHDLIANRVDLAVRLGQPKESGNVVKPLALVSEPIVAAPPLASQWSHVVRPRDLEGAPWARHSLVSRSDTLTFWVQRGKGRRQATAPRAVQHRGRSPGSAAAKESASACCPNI